MEPRCGAARRLSLWSAWLDLAKAQASRFFQAVAGALPHQAVGLEGSDEGVHLHQYALRLGMALQQFGGKRRFLARLLHQALDGRRRIELGWRAAAGLVAQLVLAILDPALPGHAHGLDVEFLQLGDLPAEQGL